MDYFINIFNNLGQNYIYGFALTVLIAVNIFVGSLKGLIDRQFDKEKFRKGFLWGLGIAIATYVTYLIGGLIPDLLVVTVADAEVNLQTAISMIMVAGIAHYAKDIFDKIQGAIIKK